MAMLLSQNISLIAGLPKKVLLPRIVYVEVLTFNMEFTSRPVPPKHKQVLVEAKNIFDTPTAKPLLVENNEKASVFNLKSIQGNGVRCSYIELTANCSTVINLTVLEG